MAYGAKLLSGVSLVLFSLFPAAVANVTYVVDQRPVDLGTAGNFGIIAGGTGSYDPDVTGSILAANYVSFVRSILHSPYVKAPGAYDLMGLPQGKGEMALQAVADMRAAYANVTARAGTYHSAAALNIAQAGPSGNVIFLGNENCVFIIQGTILAAGYISFGAGAQVYGRALAKRNVVIPAGS
ncbi:hypothetical protein T492DRAFT_872554 [Pavlovales sp. CCMP2436]|nr:hypothetical protein T492DRAFT_872554 [Pavlovales sp. CCMP2436]